MRAAMAAASLVLPQSPPLPPSSKKYVVSLSPTPVNPSMAHEDATSVTTPLPAAPRSPDLPSPPPPPPPPATFKEAASATLLDVALLPLSPLPSHLAPFLLPNSPLSPEEKRELLTKAYLRSASSGNYETLEWLLSCPYLTDEPQSHIARAAARRVSTSSINSLSMDPTQSTTRPEDELPDAAPRKWVDLEAKDEDGNTALGLCVALGHAEGVRVLVEGGASVYNGDNAGWTPLHWAVQNNDIPIAAYLLNHRASPLVQSRKGLSPKDLIKKGRNGAAMLAVLSGAEEAYFIQDQQQEAAAAASAEKESTTSKDVPGQLKQSEESQEGGAGEAKVNGEREGTTSSRRVSQISLTPPRKGSLASVPPPWAIIQDRVDEEKRERAMKHKTAMAMLSAQSLNVDPKVLGVKLPARDEDLDSEGRGIEDDEEEEEEDEGISNPFVWERCLPDQMLVFSIDDLPIIFDTVITNVTPVRQRARRLIPANVLFLCARYSHYFGTNDLLEELVVGAMEQIEAAVHRRPDDMANCAFWLSNTLLLLYYLRKEPNLATATGEFQFHLCDLIKEIFVFVTRDAERRIDKVLEPALLDHEQLPGFEHIEFESDWSGSRFVRKLTGKTGKKPPVKPTAMSAFEEPTTTVSRSRQSSVISLSSVSGSTIGASSMDNDLPPEKITSLLSSTLFVLQLYEIPPSIVVQAFSQLYYWIACEVFNRLLSNRKYLCRSKAMQIRLNVTSLEDWARSNRMPIKVVSVHFAPLNQLLQWLQCLSSEASIDGLIGTIQSLRSLNPLQLRKGVRDYRYEVDEPRMHEDCDQYLQQIQKQWERVQVQKHVDKVEAEIRSGIRQQQQQQQQQKQPQNETDGNLPTSGSDPNLSEKQPDDVQKSIDEAFADSSGFGSYVPPDGSEAAGEMLSSRYMLPFAVPSSAEMLLNFRSKDAFGPFSSYSRKGSIVVDPSASVSKGSRAEIEAVSADETKLPNGNHHNIDDDQRSEVGEEPDTRFVPVLPDDFFSELDAAKARAYALAAAKRQASIGVTPPPVPSKATPPPVPRNGLGFDLAGFGGAVGGGGNVTESGRNFLTGRRRSSVMNYRNNANLAVSEEDEEEMDSPKGYIGDPMSFTGPNYHVNISEEEEDNWDQNDGILAHDTPKPKPRFEAQFARRPSQASDT